MNKETDHETILVLQGGGSLGAYECGVFKTLAKHNIQFDVIVGTSIGAVNVALIVGSKEDDAATNLENFWLELAENTTSIIPEPERSYFSTVYASIWGNPHVALPTSRIPLTI